MSIPIGSSDALIKRLICSVPGPSSYPGSKITHFKKIGANSRIDYEDMIFFDDEHRNSEVGRLSVLFVLVTHSGTDLGTFEEGIREWRLRQEARVDDKENL